MEEVISFFSNFTEEEYQLRLDYYDTNLSSSDYNLRRDAFGKYFHPVLGNYERQAYSRSKFFERKPELFLAEKKFLLRRVLFQIKQYNNPTLGKQLATNLNADVIYRGYFGPIKKTTSPDLRFSNAFFATETNGSFKIIYEEFFNVGKWERPHDHEPLFISDFGELVDTAKFLAPEEELSLMDYDAE